MYNGEEIKVSKVPGAQVVKMPVNEVFTIVTEKHEPILMNNMEVLTHSKKEWDKYLTKRVLIWNEN
jgi:hypothetical protein